MSFGDCLVNRYSKRHHRAAVDRETDLPLGAGEPCPAHHVTRSSNPSPVGEVRRPCYIEAASTPTTWIWHHGENLLVLQEELLSKSKGV